MDGERWIKGVCFQGFLAFSFFKYCFHKPINLCLPGLSPRVFTLLQEGEDTPYSWEYSSKKPLREWWSHLRWHMPWFNLSSLARVCTLGPAPYFLSEGMFGLDAIWEKLFLHELLAAFKSLLKVWKIWDSSVWGCWASPRSLPPSLPLTQQLWLKRLSFGTAIQKRGRFSGPMWCN